MTKREFLFSLCLLSFLLSLAEVIFAFACLPVLVTGQVSRKLFWLLCPRGGPITSMESFALPLGPDVHQCPKEVFLSQH